MSDCDDEIDSRPPLSSDRFRYKLLKGPWDSPGEFVRTLNTFGKVGWETVHVHYAEGRPSHALLKMWCDGNGST